MLLTSWGIIGEEQLKVPLLVVFPRNRYTVPLRYLADFFRKWALSLWLLMFFEAFITLSKAVWLKRKFNYDIIHLRDGEPFLFLPHLLGLPFRGYNWLISLTASNIYTPSTKNFQLRIYAAVVKFINSGLWRPLYRASLARNSFVFITQNAKAQRDYSSYLQGVFDGKVIYLPLGADRVKNVILKENARRYFSLPQDRVILLSFGAPHTGKDMEIIFCAIKEIPNIYLVHAGSYRFGLGVNLMDLAEKYPILDRVLIKNHYIPEEEKPYYFFAADAVILSYTKQFLSTTSLLWDACRFGIPVIASDNSQLKELVETFRMGLLFSAQDADSLKQAIQRFMELEPEEIETLKDNCHRFANEFSMGTWAQKCLEIYQVLLSNKTL